MGRSRHLNVDCARSQEAYFAKIRSAAHDLAGGNSDVSCIREGCAEHLHATYQGSQLIMRCPSCGIIYRGSLHRLMEYYD